MSDKQIVWGAVLLAVALLSLGASSARAHHPEPAPAEPEYVYPDSAEPEYVDPEAVDEGPAEIGFNAISGGLHFGTMIPTHDALRIDAGFALDRGNCSGANGTPLVILSGTSSGGAMSVARRRSS